MLELLQACTILRVQSWDNTGNVPAPRAAEQLLALQWPRKAGSEAAGALAGGKVEILCIGPADWLALADVVLAAPLLQALSSAFTETSFRVANVSSALTRFGVSGANAALLLNKGTSLDLEPQSFAPGACARTRIANIAVVVRCTRPSVFECIVTRSYEDYFRAWLTDAAQEFPDAS